MPNLLRRSLRMTSSAPKFFSFPTANNSPIQGTSNLQDSGRASNEFGPSRVQEGRGHAEMVPGASHVQEGREHAGAVLGVSRVQGDREPVLEASQVQESDYFENVFGSRGQEEGEDAEAIRTSELQEDRDASIHPDKQLEAPIRKSRGTNFGETQLSMVKFTIQTLQKLADSAPVPGLGAAFATLLDVLNNVQQTRDNEEGLEKLKERFNRLTPIFSHIAEHQEEETKLHPIIEGIALEVKSLTDDLRAASKRGKISQFFNSTDNASALSKHIMVLDQIVASDSTKMNRNSVMNVTNLTAGDGAEGGSSAIAGGAGGAGGAFKVSTKDGVSYNYSGLQGRLSLNHGHSVFYTIYRIGGSGGKGGWGFTTGGDGGDGGGFDFS
ncbi:hypothetical protein D9758_016922 [Tetrapyrgos nigripes]|uniref:Uncharacterized protein n=1 Tax=Tetrapyrgos nigripes TaxID=182062 RepID=A0A8H5CKK5_9AGAR|nr:hypothetical protein D9758_016922 [Tetrapyrgos nigripes]